jgi:integrase
VNKSTAARVARRARGKGDHHNALPYAEIGAFMGLLRQQRSVAARALEFLMLTSARTGEVIGARWDEIDPATGLWTIPAERMKAGKEHRVPLSTAALSIIQGMAEVRAGDFIFPGAKTGRPLSNMALAMLLRRIGRGDLTVHGFRSTFRDWAGDCTDFPRRSLRWHWRIPSATALSWRIGEAMG